LKQLSILIIDDSEADRYLLKRDLQSLDIPLAIAEAEDGEEALDFFKDHVVNKEIYPNVYPPQIVFLDINMPKVNGFQFLDEFIKIRQDVNAEQSVFIMMSSSEHEEDFKKAQSYSFVVSSVAKAKFSDRELKEKIQAVIAA